MMLSELRTEIVDALTGVGIKSYAVPPQAFTTGAVIEPAADYIAEGATFGHKLVRYEVFMMVSSSPKWTQEVEALIPKALDALARAGWALETVSLENFVMTATQRALVGARITIAAEVAIKEMI